MLVSCCTNPKKQKTKISGLVLEPARTAVKLLLGYSMGKIISNTLEPYLETLATMSQYFDGTKTAVALPHCSESTIESVAGWCIFGSEVWLE